MEIKMYLFYYYLLQACRLQSVHADGQVSDVKDSNKHFSN